MYSAFDVALYCIYYCSQKLNKSISNLELQKILYYTQGAFLHHKEKLCFREKIVAWKYGPVVTDVYYPLKKFGANKMALETEPTNIADEDKQLIKEICKSKTNVGALELAFQTHEEDPWKETPQSHEISIKLIKEYFDKNPERLEKID